MTEMETEQDKWPLQAQVKTQLLAHADINGWLRSSCEMTDYAARRDPTWSAILLGTISPEEAEARRQGELD